ncbi:heme peroxidase [Artemisia annua]|uniref:Peroxidase n=1 Tax=Artemisia annua TaxID=35608 RepID=A0A2U1N2U0_ARTAN|nr:heme peroxidase [Artemisia annua]
MKLEPLSTTINLSFSCSSLALDPRKMFTYEIHVYCVAFINTWLLVTVKAKVITEVDSNIPLCENLTLLKLNCIQGCDASVLLDTTANFTGEKGAGPNAGSIRGFNVIDTIKTQLESQCAGVVSCADILAAAARDSVVALGGPGWNLVFGRRDSTTASASTANSNLPAPTLSLSGLISSFSNQNLNANELVALSGAHTIDQARCTTFRSRLTDDNNINASFATSTRANCPTSGGDNNLSPLDATPTIFDNSYYKDLINQRGIKLWDGLGPEPRAQYFRRAPSMIVHRYMVLVHEAFSQAQQ